ncbi:MAG: PQQ-binding-like beta-propeller repeat protein [Pirellulaceae bacterium]
MNPAPSFPVLIRLSITAAVLLMSTNLQAEWPQFRGPRGDGVAEVKDAPLRWSPTENIAWRTEVPGTGWSSPVLLGDKIWITTADVEEATKEQFEKKLADAPPFAQRTSALASRVVLKAVEVDLATGELGKVVELFEVTDPDPVHATNSYASPTPVTDGTHLYCHFGTYGTVCVDPASGKILWKNEEHRLRHNVGPGSSPILEGEHLILACDGVDLQYVAALDKETGKTVWRTERPEHRNEDGDRLKAYTTPLMVRSPERTQVVILGAQWLCGYDPNTGEELWRFDHGEGFSNVPTPVHKDGVVFISTGFTRPELVAVRIDGDGDVTETHELWRMNRQVPTKPSPVLVDNRLYMVSDRGVATCVDIKTGETVWVERLGGNHSTSPTLAEGRIYFSDEDGKTTVLQPGDQYKVLAENDLKEQIMATPIFLDGLIILRTDKAVYRIGT